MTESLQRRARYVPPGFFGPMHVFSAMLDQWMGTCSPPVWKVLCYVFRRTLGFGKQFDSISIKQFSDGLKTRDEKILDYGTGLSRSTIHLAIDEAERQGRLLRQRREYRPGRDAPTKYALNFAVLKPHSEPAEQGSPAIGPREPTGRTEGVRVSASQSSVLGSLVQEEAVDTSSITSISQPLIDS